MVRSQSFDNVNASINKIDVQLSFNPIVYSKGMFLRDADFESPVSYYKTEGENGDYERSV